MKYVAKVLLAMLFVISLNVAVITGSYYLWFDVDKPLLILGPPRILNDDVYPGSIVVYERHLAKIRSCVGVIKQWLVGETTYQLSDFAGSLPKGFSGKIAHQFIIPGDINPGQYVLQSIVVYPPSLLCNPLQSIVVEMTDIPLTIKPRPIENQADYKALYAESKHIYC